ncbi:VanZ family protein [Marinilactibacillus sp. Marseille-P9653]|uniref:VanZ family protein n=1 Tax=Marinilactibacillus sp. Marseille-P9653 TaxID=2866583 RepID=UPI001CE3D11F|nr:VanZ family protein [Marinilactibacillus sp. Marseille-P9653]
MDIYIMPIRTAVIFFFLLSFFLLIPWLIYSYRKYGYLSIWASMVAYSFIFYMLTALFLVLLPLPATRDIRSLQSPDTKHYSLIPFQFIWDIVHSSAVITQLSTYIELFKQSAFLQAFFNLLLLLPFGVYLRYFFQSEKYWKKVFGLGFLVSLFFEVTQLTGIYGLYNAPYRIFDIDDLFLNSTGALLGFFIAPVILSLFPSRKTIQEKSLQVKKRSYIYPLQELLAVVVDYLIIKMSWNLTGGFFTSNTFIEFLYTMVGFMIFFFVIPIIWNGKTIGTSILRFKLTSINGGVPDWRSLLKRTFSIGLPSVLTSVVRVISKVELDISSPFYIYQVWFDVVAIIVYFILWSVLFIHILFTLIQKGKHPFYFDRVASLIAKRDSAAT